MSACPRLARTLVRGHRSVRLTPCAHRPLLAAVSVGSATHRSIHASSCLLTKPTNPDPRENPANELAPNADVNVGQKRLADFDLKGKVFIVTGAAQGLGLALAEGLVEAGGKGDTSPSRIR